MIGRVELGVSFSNGGFVVRGEEHCDDLLEVDGAVLSVDGSGAAGGHDIRDVKTADVLGVNRRGTLPGLEVGISRSGKPK